MKLNFIHICDTAFLSITGSLNIIGIFEGITAFKLPAIHPKMTVVANLEGTTGRHIFEVILEDPDSKKMASIKGTFALTSPNKKFGIISNINNIKLQSKGIYQIKISVDNTLLGQTSFEVKEGFTQ